MLIESLYCGCRVGLSASHRVSIPKPRGLRPLPERRLFASHRSSFRHGLNRSRLGLVTVSSPASKLAGRVISTSVTVRPCASAYPAGSCAVGAHLSLLLSWHRRAHQARERLRRSLMYEPGVMRA